ncbi:MAG: hypothetical protein LUG27_05385 [Clostridiales bacterium]|nr:hypothetical protein [Clostridiales bacterium]
MLRRTKAEVWSDMRADEMDEMLLRRIFTPGVPTRGLAWELEDGRFLFMWVCDMGYYAHVLDRDCRDDGPFAAVFCRVMACPDGVLLEHAAGSVNKVAGITPVDAAGARPVDYPWLKFRLKHSFIFHLKHLFIF